MAAPRRRLLGHRLGSDLLRDHQLGPRELERGRERVEPRHLRDGAQRRPSARVRPDPSRAPDPHVAIIAQTIFGVVLALLLGWKWGPLNGFGVISYAATSLVIVVYIIVCISDDRLLRQKARAEWNWWLHGIFPALGALAFLPPLYYQYRPLAAEPFRFGNYAAIAAFALAIIVTAYVATPKRGVLDNADRIFVEEETVGPAGPFDVPRPRRPTASGWPSPPSITSSPRDEMIWGFGPDSSRCWRSSPGPSSLRDERLLHRADPVRGRPRQRIDFSRQQRHRAGRRPRRRARRLARRRAAGVTPGPRGFATIIPEFGQLIDQVRSPVTYVFDVEDETIHMNDRISFPLRPMVGVVGVATDGEEIANGWAGRHGGNLDDHLHGPGATLYFPVRQPGGSSRSATCMRRWATARSAAPASRSRARSSPASTC